MLKVAVVVGSIGVMTTAGWASGGHSSKKVSAGEQLFLTDSGPHVGGTTELFKVHIDPLMGRGNLEYLTTIPFEQVDALACTPDGKRCYAIDKAHNDPHSAGELGYVDLSDMSWHLIGVVQDAGGPIPGIVLASFDRHGKLFAGSEDTEKIYQVNTGTGMAAEVGEVFEAATNTYIGLNGADFAFAADGRCFLCTNAEDACFQITMPATFPNDIMAFRMNSLPPGLKVTGVAVRANGFGTLIASEKVGDNFLTLPRGVGGILDTFPMYLNGSPYTYTFGDMSAGSMKLCTRTIGYYKSHDWDGAGVNICGVPVDETMGKKILWAATGKNFSMYFAQLIAAKLNVNDSGGVTVIDAAESWLCKQSNAVSGGQLIWDAHFTSKAQKYMATFYQEKLDWFNNAYECDDDDDHHDNEHHDRHRRRIRRRARHHH